MQAVGGDAREGAVVEDHDAVCALCEAFHGEEAVVGVDDDVVGVLSIREDGVGLDELLWKAVV